MKKYIINVITIIFIAAVSFYSCTDNEQKEQVNDETKEIEAQSQELGKNIDENDPDQIGKSESQLDTIKNDK